MAYPWGENIWDHPDPLVISHSSRGTLRTCERKFEITKFYQDIPSDESMEGEVGKAIHAGYQKYLMTEDLDEALLEMMFAYPIKENSDAGEGRSLEACVATLERMVQNIRLLEYKIANIQCLDESVRPAIEVEFEIWLEGPIFNGRPIVYVGFIDAILFNVLSGEFMVVDIKSHRRNNFNPAAEFTFHGQCLPYGVVLQRATDQDIHRFQVMYIGAYIDILEPIIQPCVFQKTETNVQEWFTGLYFDVKAMVEMGAVDHWPRREHGCQLYGKPCYFLSLCQEKDKPTLQAMINAQPARLRRTARARKPWVRFILPMPGISSPANGVK